MSTPSATPSPVIIVDDGEFADVRQLLAQLDVGYREERSLESVAEGASCGLLITSARRALASGNGGATEAHRPCRLHVVVYDTMSRSLHRVLVQSGCDVVIGRPVHPAVLRLLISHALYSGPERRNLGRAAMAAPVKLRVDRRPREATLVQLSLRGCGLASSQSAEIGQDVEVILPPELTGGKALTLGGHVLAAGSSAADAGRSRDISVRFRSPHAAVRTVLKGVMERHSLVTTTAPARNPASRPARAPAEAPTAATAVLPDAGGEGAASGADQRSGPRKLFPRRVLAAAGGGTQALIGRDLSAGGMRVRPVPGLQLGDEFKLALYGNGEQPALVLRAVVGRDDGWDGLVLHFRDVGASVAAELERLVESLPAARATKGAGGRAPGVVVSEIIEHQ
jgi:hypothetical protein